MTEPSDRLAYRWHGTEDPGRYVIHSQNALIKADWPLHLSFEEGTS